ncbi:hypothetical protein [Actinoplanes sp. ATCC 53533]|uniref:hypothetical protein n=1 Tax=Actinoplanes sp. ATCC 53533 TaxID=1288362 RepID=UPI001F45D1E8|nr:hypothetical protein [Actinoplanes sp. ATCC 53533]
MATALLAVGGGAVAAVAASTAKDRGYNASIPAGATFWETNRDRNACTGALFQCTNVAQAPFEFSKIFATFRG